MDGEALAALEGWLVDRGLRGGDAAALLEGFAERAVAAGLPLARLMVGSDLLHPTVGGRGYRWERGRGVALEEYDREAAGAPDNPNFLESPLYPLVTRRLPELRRRLAFDYEPGEFPLLDRLRAGGATDYVAFLVEYGAEAAFGAVDGLAATAATDAAEGFAEAHVAALRRLVPRLALAHKTITAIATARTLMATYLGEDAAERVLAGSIGRGAAEMIRAAVWYSDLEGFTRLADTLPTDRLIAFLNAYAECFVEIIHGHGGQVLKFMGDGILAMFPLDGPRAAGCGAALEAAVAAQRAAERLFRTRVAAGEPVSRCFIGLHVGEMLYGNVGSADRLDFTVLGPAVNETSRIERLCRSLEQAVIVSEPFCRGLEPADRERLVSLGRFALRGVGRAQELFTLDPAILTLAGVVLPQTAVLGTTE